VEERYEPVVSNERVKKKDKGLEGKGNSSEAVLES